MKRLKRLFASLTRNGVLAIMLVVMCGSYWVYAGRGVYGVYDGDEPKNEFHVVKNVTGDVSEEIPTSFDFTVTALGEDFVTDWSDDYEPTEDDFPKPDTSIVTVDSTVPEGTIVSVNAQRVTVSENLEPIDDYAVTTDYHLSQAKEQVLVVGGYWSRWQDYGNDDVYSEFRCNLDLDESSIAVDLDVSDTERMNPNIPYWVRVRQSLPDTPENEGVVPTEDVYEMRVTNPHLLITGLEPGDYSVSIGTEGFYGTECYWYSQGAYPNYDYDGYYASQAYTDGEGSFRIVRSDGHSGTTNYSLYDIASGEKVQDVSIDDDTENQTITVTGLLAFHSYMVVSDCENENCKDDFSILWCIYDSMSAAHGELRICSDEYGRLPIVRTNGHHGVTKYSVYDNDGDIVSMFSIGEDTPNQKFTVSGLEPSRLYRVVSDDLSGQKSAKVRGVNEGDIDSDYEISLNSNLDTTLEVTNDYKDLVERGDLIIRKYVYGMHSNKADTFDFRLSLYRDGVLTSACDGNEARYGMLFNSGVSTFSLMDNQYAMATKIPCGVNYVLEEYDASADDYITVDDGMMGTFSTTLSEAISISTRDRGSYKYVHEYYVEYPDGERVLEGRSDVGSSETDLLVNDMEHYDESNVERQPVFAPYGGTEYTYEYFGDAYGTLGSDGYAVDSDKSYVVATEDGREVIVLKYVRQAPRPKVGSYKYVHEYYVEDADGDREFEGRSEVKSSADDLIVNDDIHYTADMVKRETTFMADDGVARTYTYDDSAYGLMDGDDYDVNDDMEYAVVTESGTQVIILRYVRHEDPEPAEAKGFYRYVHEYYTEDSDGNRELDGISSIMSSEKDLDIDDDVTYTVSDVKKAPVYNGATYTYKEVAYGDVADDEYTVDSDMKHVVATEDGDQIIILRYVKKKAESVSVNGFYRYVHEYYTEQEDGELRLDGTSDVMSSEKDLEIDENIAYTVDDVGRQPIYGGHTYEYTGGAYGKAISNGYDYDVDKDMNWVVATKDGSQVIILRYMRKSSGTVSVNGTYKYVHEYYTENSDGDLILDGKSDVVSSDKLEINDKVHYTEKDVEKRPVYQNREYKYESADYGKILDGDYAIDFDMDYVVATEDGSEIIILKYIRREDVKGFYHVVHEYYVEDGDGNRALEGISGLLPSSQVDIDDSVHYTVDDVGKITRFEADGITHEYDYTSGGYGIVLDDEYLMDSDMEYVVATENGGEVIILQYVRKLMTTGIDVPVNDTFGTLIINKTVIGDLGNKKKDFNFVLILDDKTIDGEYDDFTFENGKAAFTLRHGESKRVTLSDGIGYTVTEKSAKNYETTVKNGSGTIKGDKAVVVSFVNKCTKTKPADEKPNKTDKPSGNTNNGSGKTNKKDKTLVSSNTGTPASGSDNNASETPSGSSQPGSGSSSYGGGSGSSSGGASYSGGGPASDSGSSSMSRQAESVRTSDSLLANRYLMVVLVFAGILSVCGVLAYRRFRRK